MKTVPLHGKKAAGRVALVDDEDYEMVSRHRWFIIPSGYAQRTSRLPLFESCPECGYLPRPGIDPTRSVTTHRVLKHGARNRGERKSIVMHRMILGLAHGDPREGDHINRNRLDNRRENLRIVPGKIQSQNRGPITLIKGKPAASQYRGVYKVKKRGRWTGRWKAAVAGHYLGCFTSEEAAAKAAADYRLQTMPYAVD